jgi:hypothetical protein
LSLCRSNRERPRGYDRQHDDSSSHGNLPSSFSGEFAQNVGRAAERPGSARPRSAGMHRQSVLIPLAR